MKKFTLYYFKADDEGGYGVCKSKDFTPMRGYRPQTGWRAEKSVKIADFDTIEELATIFQADEKEENDAYLKEAQNNTDPDVVFGEVVYHNFNYHYAEAKMMIEEMMDTEDFI